jgi:hypothetical protein
MVLAHGIGGRQDLPIPLVLLLIGAGLAVMVSFVALGALWQSSRFGGEAGRPVPRGFQRFADAAGTRIALRLIGLVVALLTLAAAVFGPAEDSDNPTPWMVFVVFWIGLVPASLVAGPIWRLLNPLRTIHRAITRLSGTKPLRDLPPRIGYWPAAAGLFAFTWLELVAPGNTEESTLVLWFAVYSIVMIVASAVFGEAWFDRADAFEAYSSLIGRLSPLGRRGDGRLVLRNPFDGLAGLPTAPGLVAIVSVMLGSTAYDGFSSSSFWVNALQAGPLPRTLTGTLGLLGMVLLVAATYWVCTRSTGHEQLAHSLIPIAVGYLVAHYFSLFVFGTQQTAILWSDPFGTGANLLGTGNLTVDFALVSATAVAVIRACAVVVGHVLGVFAAHDRAVAVLPRSRALTGQVPLLMLMVFYTVGGLTLLFAA